MKAERVVRIKRNASSSRGAWPAVACRARTPLKATMWEGRSDTAGSIFFRGKRRAFYLCVRHCPVEDSHRNDDVSRDRCRVSVRGSEIARRLASPMLSRIAKQKDAEDASYAALLFVARLKACVTGSRVSAGGKDSGLRKSGLPRNAPPGGVLRRAQAHVEQEPEGIPFGECGARHQVGSWMIGEGG